MPWLIPVVAGGFEMSWAIELKYTEGFATLWPTIGTVTAMVISVVLLGELTTVACMVCILPIVSGMIGLKIFSPS